eukprot:8025993-Pyramimonas_sp.AAC.1
MSDFVHLRDSLIFIFELSSSKFDYSDPSKALRVGTHAYSALKLKLEERKKPLFSGFNADLASGLSTEDTRTV